MPSVTIHRVGGAKKAPEVCRLVETLYLAGKRVVVYLSDASRAAFINEYLWTFSQPSFVPHALWSGAGEVEEPVVLVAGAVANPNAATALVVGDKLADLETAAPFDEIHDLVAQVAEDAGKAEAWKAAGYTVKTVSGAGAPRT